MDITNSPPAPAGGSAQPGRGVRSDHKTKTRRTTRFADKMHQGPSLACFARQTSPTAGGGGESTAFTNAHKPPTIRSQTLMTTTPPTTTESGLMNTPKPGVSPLMQSFGWLLAVLFIASCSILQPLTAAQETLQSQPQTLPQQDETGEQVEEVDGWTEQDIVAAQQLSQQLSVAEWLGPMAPVALSPFFGIMLLSGLSFFGATGLHTTIRCSARTLHCTMHRLLDIFRTDRPDISATIHKGE